MPSNLPIYVTNTMGHRLEEFHPLRPDRVAVYSCGPTVYSYVHIGNFRAYIFADTLRRVLEYNGYDVIHVQNITDVGHLTDETLSAGLDRIEAAAQRENLSPEDIVRHYTEVFLQDSRRLNLKEPAFMPRASKYVGPMIELAQRLIDSDHGYPAGENVYFDVTTFPAYGALSGNSVEDLIAGARVEVGEGKRSPADFALWRGAGEEKLMRFESPWGPGVPGWHLECSAMSMDLLGEQIDIHTGGVDNIFPHHEDEIAQSEAATGKQFVRYWMHNQWLQLPNDEKMSKSLGNIFTVSDLLERGFHPLSLRYFNFQANYRTPLNFSWEALEAAQTGLVRVWEAVAELIQLGQPEEMGKNAEGYQERFHRAINQDLDLPSAVAVLHDVLGSKLPPGQKLTLVEDFDRVLGLQLAETARRLSEISPAEQELVAARASARADRDWGRSDALRAELAGSGVEIRDTPSGQRWVRKDFLPSDSRQPQDAPSR